MDGSWAVILIVAASQIKAVKLDVQWWLISTSNCFSSCFLHAPVSDPFYLFTNGAIHSVFSNMDPLSGTDVIQTESPENFVVIFEILPIDKEWKSNEITYFRSWKSCGFNDRNATLQVDFLPTSTTLEFKLKLFNCVLLTEQNSNSVSFSQSQCCRLLKLLLSRFSSKVDVVRRSCPSQVSSSPLSIYWVVSIFDVRMKFLS